MGGQPPSSRCAAGPVALSTAIYSLLLLAYPPEFRREYGPHMAQVFQDCCLRAFRRSGLPGLAYGSILLLIGLGFLMPGLASQLAELPWWILGLGHGV